MTNVQRRFITMCIYKDTISRDEKNQPTNLTLKKTKKYQNIT